MSATDEQFKIWVLIGALSVASIIIGFIVKVMLNEVVKRLDSMINELRRLGQNTVSHQEKISYLIDAQKAINDRLNNHAERIRDVELIVKPGIQGLQITK